MAVVAKRKFIVLYLILKISTSLTNIGHGIIIVISSSRRRSLG